MLSSWKKFCFMGGILLNSVTLPGTINVLGLSPAVWAMGNLGHAGYGASLDGMWPYSYTCDVGTLPNQTIPDNSGPQAALDTGSDNKDSGLSFFAGAEVECVYVCGAFSFLLSSPRGAVLSPLPTFPLILALSAKFEC
jgi:hypothetical protein